ncbi:Uncharacterised protein [Salmonella enterica subsp. enterica serovar Typhi]|nr:Uncharacterised protein [Salmonella enterica subsp. enterica serovar Typhi]CXA63759.1 Uncharacterised protein [Salmonella enterica subsp. enterica serovar Typhi]
MNTHVRVSVRIILHQFRHHLRQRRIRVVMMFEGAQRVDQRSPFPASYPHGEQEHNLEVGGAGRHDTVAAKPCCDQRSRYAGCFQFAIVAHTRRQDTDFNRVQHTPVIRQVFKAVPGFPGAHDPAVLVGCQQFCRRVGEVIRFTGLWIGDDVFIPRFKEPVAFIGKLFIKTRHRLTEINRFVNHLLSQGQAAVTVHHRYRHIVGCADGI